jgi:hypothetical protein
MMNFAEKQRYILSGAAEIGLFGIKCLFLFAIFFRTEQVSRSNNNLYAITFIIEAFVLLPLLYFLISVAKLQSPGWKGFLILSLLGSLAFSIPFYLLRSSRED